MENLSTAPLLIGFKSLIDILKKLCRKKEKQIDVIWF